MPTCPSCKDGQMSIRFSQAGKPDEVTKMNCVICQGTATITQQQLKYIEQEKNRWCRCEKSSGSSYVADTRKMKHHWKCNDCKKITQIG